MLHFFGVGVANVLGNVTHIAAGNPTFGPALEQLVFCELRAWLAYARDPRPLTFWRTADGSEVDFVVGDTVGIEGKATGAVFCRLWSSCERSGTASCSPIDAPSIRKREKLIRSRVSLGLNSASQRRTAPIPC